MAATCIIMFCMCPPGQSFILMQWWSCHECGKCSPSPSIAFLLYKQPKTHSLQCCVVSHSSHSRFSLTPELVQTIPHTTPHTLHHNVDEAAFWYYGLDDQYTAFHHSPIVSMPRCCGDVLTERTCVIDYHLSVSRR